MEANSYGFIGITYLNLESYDNAFYYLKEALDRNEHIHDDGTDLVFMIFLAQAYNEKKQLDSSFSLLAKAKEILRHAQTPQLEVLRRNERMLNTNLGEAFQLRNDLDSATFYYRLALESAIKQRSFVPNHLSIASAKLAGVFMEKNEVDSALYFARLAYSVLRNTNVYPRIRVASILLSQLHRKTGRLDSALYYQDKSNALYDSLYGKDKSHALQLLLLEEQKRHQETLRKEERSKSNQQLVGLVSITGVILIASILLFRNNRIKHKTNLALEQTLKELKATQSQLIQSEKMASLGELTAGIAHEIQNPLNFVNNFSEVNAELISEMKKELADGKGEAAAELANTIEENEQKINYHGKRADGIVKSMLQHSRANSGQKELTDINAMCEEYVRLTYHGYKAKDRAFNAKLETDFAEGLPKVNIVAQDVGRVILNLVNNAFYEVTEKSRGQSSEYTPVVKVSTKKLQGKIEIHVKDNGRGIPTEVREKIFQPFFTTKPTGQGTGLGLSLSYDIIKAHGGKLEVNTKEGEGTEFVVQLPG
jgi:signal transduction histidine kinase